MKYVIMCGGYYEQWDTPKQLQTINGEPLVARTVRLLQENGIKAKDIFISSNDKSFDGFGVERLEHKNSYRYEDGKLNGYWLDAFYLKFKSNQKVTYLFGDVCFTDEAIKAIIKSPAAGNILYGSKEAANKEGKNIGEPFAYVVNDFKSFAAGIKAVKKLQDEGKTDRVPLVWELYRYLNELDINRQAVKNDTFRIIDDGTDDIDSPTKLELLRSRFEIKANVFYFKHLNKIGGVESFLFYLAERHCKNDITVYYQTGDIRQIERLKKYVRALRYNPGQKIRCKKAFFNYNLDIIDSVEAEEYIQIIHADYKARGIKPATSEKITKYIAVSKTAAAGFTEITGFPCEVCYNPWPTAAGKPLVLLSATRLTKEKGKERIIKLSNALKAAGVSFLWFIFTNDEKPIDDEDIVYIPPRLNVVDYMQRADWFVQLSDDEAYCYSVAEALGQGVPCIVTPCPVFKELGLNSENSITVNFDITNVPVEKIKKGLKIKPFVYSKTNMIWEKLLAPGKSTYEPPKDEGLVLCECVKIYDDIVTGKRVYQGDQFKVTKKRAAELIKSGVVKRI